MVVVWSDVGLAGWLIHWLVGWVVGRLVCWLDIVVVWSDCFVLEVRLLAVHWWWTVDGG